MNRGPCLGVGRVARYCRIALMGHMSDPVLSMYTAVSLLNWSVFVRPSTTLIIVGLVWESIARPEASIVGGDSGLDVTSPILRKPKKAKHAAAHRRVCR